MWQYLFYFFLAYSLYQLVFKFIIPIYRTTRQVKRSFRNMQENMNERMGGQPYQQQQQQQTKAAPTQQTKSSAGEYIDFEEVKD